MGEAECGAVGIRPAAVRAGIELRLRRRGR